MTFEIQLRYSTPLTPVKDLDEVLREFLTLVGYLPEGEGGDRSLAYRLVRDCLLKNPERAWYAEELSAVLRTSKPSIYRHINKLKAMDLLEEVPEVKETGKGRKGYRIRYGNLARAWDFVEANSQNALKRYRETVDHLQGLVEGARRPAPATTSERKEPGGRVSVAPLSRP